MPQGNPAAYQDPRIQRQRPLAQQRPVAAGGEQRAPRQPATLPAGQPQQRPGAPSTAVQPYAGYAAATPFTGANNLLSTQIAPMEGPDRAELAADALRLFEERQGEERQAGIQDIGRSAASLGRIGSGVTTSQLGDLELQLGRERNRMEQALAGDAAGQTLADQLAQRQELRGERGFQSEQERQAMQDYMNFLTLQYGLTGQAANLGFQNPLVPGSVGGGGGIDWQQLGATVGGMIPGGS